MRYSYPHYYGNHLYSYPHYPPITATNKSSKGTATQCFEKNDKKRESDDKDIIFEILGIKLHYDDILLLCLIFFLYNEGVKDEFLFIALILLLLS